MDGKGLFVISFEVIPLQGSMMAKVRMPGSKSYTNRALIMAALTKGSVCLENPLYSDDTKAMIECLRALGLKIEMEPEQLIVHGDIGCIEDKNYQLFAFDSGTTVRFMLALLCIVPGVKTIQGGKRLNERPIRDLIDGLRSLGARIEYCEKEGELPVKITTSSLFGSIVHLKGDISSQFCSALLLISPYISENFRVRLTTPLISKPYIEMTLNCMQDWGVGVLQEKEGGFFIPAGQCYRKKRYVIEGDFSSAGYFFAIAVLTKSTMSVENLNPFSSQADRKFLNILEKMGNRAIMQENEVCIEGKQILPLDIDMEDCPDQIMTLAVLAAFAQGITKISGVRSLRVKESDRIAALKKNLNKMGILTKDTHDVLTIYGGSPHGAVIDTCNDHRIAMAFAVAGMVLPGVVICHPEVVNKTFPTFWKVLSDLRNYTNRNK